MLKSSVKFVLLYLECELPANNIIDIIIRNELLLHKWLEVEFDFQEGYIIWTHSMCIAIIFYCLLTLIVYWIILLDLGRPIYFYFKGYGCFGCMHAVAAEARNSNQSPWNWSCRLFWVAMWVSEIRTQVLEEQPVLLTAGHLSSLLMGFKKKMPLPHSYLCFPSFPLHVFKMLGKSDTRLKCLGKWDGLLGEGTCLTSWF